MATSKVRSDTRLAVTAMVAVVSLASGCWFQPGFGPHRSAHNPHERSLTSANVATLTEAWSVALGGGPVLDPVVSRSGVHAVAGTGLHTHNLGDGTERWSVAVLPPPPPDGRQVVTSPSVQGDQVVVQGHGLPVFPPQPGNGFHSYDTATGAEGPLSTTGAASGSITVDGDTIATTARFELSSVNFISTLQVADRAVPSSGWTTILDTGPDIPEPTTPALGRDKVLIGRGTSVSAFTRTRPAVCHEPFPGFSFCSPIWFRSVGGTPTVPVLSDDEGTVFVGDSAGGLWALDADDGSVVWQAALGDTGPAPQVVAPPTVGDGQVYVTSSDGQVWAFDADGCGSPTCPAAWAAATGSPITKQPALAGGVLYVGSDAGTVHAFRASGCGAEQCTPLWDTGTGSRITGGPIVANGNLVVGTADGRLIAYRPS